MIRVLVVYATTHGQAARVARAAGEELRRSGAQADVVEASDRAPGPDGYDGVMVAGSVHARGYQRHLRRWVRTHAEALQRKPSAFVSVCLGVLQRDPAVDRALDAIRESFYAATGWRPALVAVVAGALPYTRYNPLTRWLMRRIVAKAKGDTDTSRDYEYTDWDAVRRFASAFALRVAEQKRLPVPPAAGSDAVLRP
jgi:menaquinone-dependent protoporphyrinogen oxidase